MKNSAIALLLLVACLIVPDAAIARPGDGSGPRFHAHPIRSHAPRINHGNHGPRHHFTPRIHSRSFHPHPIGNFQPRIHSRPSFNHHRPVFRSSHNRSFLPRVFHSGPRRDHGRTFMNNTFRPHRIHSSSFRGDPAHYRGAPYQNFRGYNQSTGRGSFLNHLPGGNPFPPQPRVSSYNFRGDPAFYRGAPYQNFRGYNGGFGFGH